MTARPPKPEIPVVTLTAEQQKLADARRDYRKAKKVLRAKFDADMEELKQTVPKCNPHVWSLPPNAKYEWWYGNWDLRNDFVYCLICEKAGGWYCPKNPTMQCEYDFDEDPLGDSCIHCGAPDERK